MFSESEGEEGASQPSSGGPDLAVAARVSEVIEDCLQSQRYNLFVAVPEPDESFPTSRGGGSPLCFPSLPLLSPFRPVNLSRHLPNLFLKAAA